MLKSFVGKLPQRLFASYRGYFWVWHLAAAGITAALAYSGLDWKFFEATRDDSLRPLIIIAGMGGFFVPILLPVFLYLHGRRANTYYVRVAAAFVQASVITWIIVAIYKAFTGRIQPDLLMALGNVDGSGSFQFGFLKHGIFWGWPSHHTAVAVAGATTLYLAFRNPNVRIAAVLWALIVAAGAAVGFHWFSDVVAGAIVGAVVGISVWRAMETTPDVDISERFPRRGARK